MTLDSALDPALIPAMVARLFREEDQAAALALLEQYGTASHEREATRVRVAALKLSEGRLAELERVIGDAQRDYRDVLAWAEYPEELRHPTWRLSPEEQGRIRAADRQQYLAWLEEFLR
jgi:hypothetical protein